MSKRMKSFVQRRQGIHKRSREIPLTKQMAELINIEYYTEAVEQEQVGGPWYSVVQSGRALPWDLLLEKLQKPAVYHD